MNERTKYVLNLLSAAMAAVILYIFLHESGHALVAAACGARITSFSIIGAHTGSIGGTYNTFTASLHYAAGMGFPFLLAVIYLIFIFNRNKRNVFYRLFSMFFSLIPVMTLLVWVFVPFAYLEGDRDNPDDVIQFLNASSLHPIPVITFFSLIFLLSLLLAWKKGVIQIWLDLVRGRVK